MKTKKVPFDIYIPATEHRAAVKVDTIQIEVISDASGNEMVTPEFRVGVFGIHITSDDPAGGDSPGRQRPLQLPPEATGLPGEDFLRGGSLRFRKPPQECEVVVGQSYRDGAHGWKTSFFGTEIQGPCPAPLLARCNSIACHPSNPRCSGSWMSPRGRA